MESAFGVDHGEISKGLFSAVGNKTGQGVHRAGIAMQRTGAKHGFTGGHIKSWDAPGKKGAAGRKLNQAGQKVTNGSRAIGRNAEVAGLGVTALGVGTAAGAGTSLYNKNKNVSKAMPKMNPFKAFTGAKKAKPAPVSQYKAPWEQKPFKPTSPYKNAGPTKLSTPQSPMGLKEGNAAKGVQANRAAHSTTKFGQQKQKFGTRSGSGSNYGSGSNFR